MVNVSYVSYFMLAAYTDIGVYKYLGFLVLVLLYTLIVAANLLLIVLIFMNRTLHEPMYMFLCSLSINELYGSTGLLPAILIQILSDVHTIPVPLCFLQIFSIHTYGAVEYVSLAIMSYDRYLAICRPLQYNSLMTPVVTASLIVAAWLYGLVVCIVMVALSSSLRLCGNRIHKVYCDNFSVVKLACSDITAVNIHGIVTFFVSIGSPLAFILYTYVKILMVCVSGSKQTQQKAISTCTPHLSSVLHFSVAATFELIQGRFNMEHLPMVLRVFLSLYWFTCQPLLNPLVYGLSLTKIRVIYSSLLNTARNACRVGAAPPAKVRH